MSGNARLYKYLDFNGGLAMLRNRNLQFTNSTRLNDPFDCHPALFDFSNVPESPYNLPPRDFLIEKGKVDTENLRNKAWICSLSKIHDSLLMWSYYCNHKGVCIGLNMEKANKYLSKIHCPIYTGSIEMEVQYRDMIDRPDYFHDHKDFFQYQLSTKAKAWEHEQEVRLLLIDPTPAGDYSSPFFAPMGPPYNSKKEVVDWKELRAYPRLGGECFESLYLGIKMEEKDKERIIIEAQKCNPNIKIYQMTIDPDAFRLKEKLFTELPLETTTRMRILSFLKNRVGDFLARYF